MLIISCSSEGIEITIGKMDDYIDIVAQFSSFDGGKRDASFSKQGGIGKPRKGNHSEATHNEEGNI